MKQAAPKFSLLALVLGSLCATGCAPMSDVTRASIEYERGDFRNRFIEDKQRCLQTGGRFYVNGPGDALDRNGLPRTRVFYTCS